LRENFIELLSESRIKSSRSAAFGGKGERQKNRPDPQLSACRLSLNYHNGGSIMGIAIINGKPGTSHVLTGTER